MDEEIIFDKEAETIQNYHNLLKKSIDIYSDPLCKKLNINNKIFTLSSSPKQSYDWYLYQEILYSRYFTDTHVDFNNTLQKTKCLIYQNSCKFLPEYWVYYNDEAGKYEILDMTKDCIVEMILWWNMFGIRYSMPVYKYFTIVKNKRPFSLLTSKRVENCLEIFRNIRKESL